MYLNHVGFLSTIVLYTNYRRSKTSNRNHVLHRQSSHPYTDFQLAR
jgi:hypothetical protein